MANRLTAKTVALPVRTGRGSLSGHPSGAGPPSIRRADDVRLKGEDHLSSQITAQVQWSVVKIPALVNGNRAILTLKAKELQLRAHVSLIPGFGQFPRHSL